MSDFLIIAHRGASGHWPENTLLAFQKALAAGANWLELDVHLTADQQLVVIHDATLQRTTNGRGQVSNYELAALRALDAGQGEKIPLLSEVLELAAGRATVNIELKGSATGSAVGRLLQQRWHKGQRQEILASSLYEKELMAFSSWLPDVPLALVAERLKPHYWALAEQLNLWSLNLKKTSIDRALLADARANRIKILAFTVNDLYEFSRLRDWGVAGVFTDFPERFVGR